MAHETIIDEVKSWIGLAMVDPRLHEYAAREILNCIQVRHELVSNGALFWIMVSCLRRCDKKGALQFAIDWSDPYSLPTADITKFQPGDHYHVLDCKFDTWSEAEAYLKKCGYRRGQLHTIYMPREGD